LKCRIENDSTLMRLLESLALAPQPEYQEMIAKRTMLDYDAIALAPREVDWHAQTHRPRMPG